jgi:hypothetical protein
MRYRMRVITLNTPPCWPPCSWRRRSHCRASVAVLARAIRPAVRARGSAPSVRGNRCSFARPVSRVPGGRSGLTTARSVTACGCPRRWACCAARRAAGRVRSPPEPRAYRIRMSGWLRRYVQLWIASSARPSRPAARDCTRPGDGHRARGSPSHGGRLGPAVGRGLPQAEQRQVGDVPGQALRAANHSWRSHRRAPATRHCRRRQPPHRAGARGRLAGECPSADRICAGTSRSVELGQRCGRRVDGRRAGDAGVGRVRSLPSRDGACPVGSLRAGV